MLCALMRQSRLTSYLQSTLRADIFSELHFADMLTDGLRVRFRSAMRGLLLLSQFDLGNSLAMGFSALSTSVSPKSALVSLRPSADFPLRMIRLFSISTGKYISSPAPSSAGLNSRSPSREEIICAARACCFGEHRTSSEMMRGVSDTVKASCQIAATTALSFSRVTSVYPCVTSGSPRAPSQISISTHLHPCSSCRRYISAVDSEVSWWPVK
mmetsp:Transcript_32401/g.68142  ORF Transcript_32401/g.68142 Transcript_32401/m.68142 type:complete len:213 (+) Transcript_32401:197-835(+)